MEAQIYDLLWKCWHEIQAMIDADHMKSWQLTPHAWMHLHLAQDADVG